MHTIVIALLQSAAALLLALQKAPQVSSSAAQEQILASAGRAIQLSSQALAATPSGYAPVLNAGIWPNALELDHSLYLDPNGQQVPLGENMQEFASYASFGDMNGDGIDDAAT